MRLRAWIAGSPLNRVHAVETTDEHGLTRFSLSVSICVHQWLSSILVAALPICAYPWLTFLLLVRDALLQRQQDPQRETAATKDIDAADDL